MSASRSLTATRTSSGSATETVACRTAGIVARARSSSPVRRVNTLASGGIASVSRICSSLVQVVPVTVVRWMTNASDDASP